MARLATRLVGADSGAQVRVLLYHDVPLRERAAFAAQLRWLARSWRFVTPGQFDDIIAKRAPVSGRSILLTFDDGFASNRAVAEEVLDPMGIRALFFVVTDFVGITDHAEARRFIASRIRPGSSAADLDDGVYNMGWTDLEALVQQGHAIGAHTRTHARLSDVSGAALEGEIVGGADALQSRLGVPIEHFAYTFGDVGSFSPEALAVARRRFRFIYSGLRGDNSRGVSANALRRDAVNPCDSKALIGALTEGAADVAYRRSRRLLDAWVALD